MKDAVRQRTIPRLGFIPFAGLCLGVGLAGALCQPHTGRAILEHPTGPAAPDDALIAFVDEAVGRTPAQNGLFVIAPDGTGRRPIAASAPGAGKRFPVWSPDHQRVAYQAQLKDFPATGQHPAVLATFDLATSRSALLTEGPGDESPSWDASGSRLAFVGVLGPSSGPAQSVLSVVGSGGGDVRLLAEPLAGPDRRLEHPRWSPDGQRIALVVVDRLRTAAEGEIYVLDVASGRWWRPFPHPGWDDRDPAWSPDGTAIAFASAPLGTGGQLPRHDLWRLDTATGVAGSLVADTTDALYDLRRPAWSPDGSRLVFDAAIVGDSLRTLRLVEATGGLLAPAFTTGWDADWAGVASAAAPTASPTAPLPTPTAGSPLPTVPVTTPTPPPGSPQPTAPATTPTPPGEPTFPVLPTLLPLPTFPPPEPTLGPPGPTFPPPTRSATSSPTEAPTRPPARTPTATSTRPAGETPAAPGRRVYLPVGYRLVDVAGEEVLPTPSETPLADPTPSPESVLEPDRPRLAPR